MHDSEERGASIVIFALLVPLLFAALALALDFGKLAYERQDLSNALDAAALAGAGSLPNDPTAAQAAAVAYAKSNDPQANPSVSFRCLVASSGASKTVVSGQVPNVCDPGTTAGAKCDEKLCSIPCVPGGGHTCNTIIVTAAKDVPFAFAPVIGVNNGNTGSLASTACKGSCGAQIPNPMDIVMVADRTGSMSDADRNAMVAGIKSTLQTMTKEQQYVALGTIGRSKTSPGTCVTSPSTSRTDGPWLPVPFSNNYTNTPATPGGVPPLNSSSTLVGGLNCLSSSGTGTYLAAPLKSAARYVLGKSSNNLSSLPTRSTPAKKAIILETDGEPNEENVTGGSTDLNTTSELGSSNGTTACNNLKAVATNAKNEGLLIITVAFGDANSARCNGSGSDLVRTVLASAASPKSAGVPSTASNDCSTPALRATENADGDYFFCAATGAEMGPIFASAVNAISTSSRLIRLPE
ncbi:pilus assembly protein TadG-related protein [Paenarthrobacter sp. AR 02]|uniref:pilus assembly protein TadG-related protein n=1 Tax=Paenarthrobacter sp. AR 02 TaxID=2899821 RepID=UPI001F2DBDA9|nr:pilus assembly protein TadG-related protein [Paenarthrobacter sp. AR 02]MCF3137760.1 pilus assembly protein TadG-related protein [Paenarthrobacter sp. AR 02]